MNYNLNTNAFLVFWITTKAYTQVAQFTGQHGAHLSAPGGPHVGPMNLAIWALIRWEILKEVNTFDYRRQNKAVTLLRNTPDVVQTHTNL